MEEEQFLTGNKEIDDFIKSRPPRPQEKEQTIDEIVEELKQHPAFITEIDESKPLPPLLEGIQQLMYESDSAEYNAENFKKDGNKHFGRSMYHWAMDNYTAGIKEKCRNKELNAILYTNRAAAQYHLGNYRSSVKDCIIARKFKPDHMKAIVRGSQCYLALSKAEDCIQWCEEGLQIDGANKELAEMKQKAEKLKRQQERDKRKQEKDAKKANEKENNLLDAIKGRGIQLGDLKGNKVRNSDLLTLALVESHHPSGARVHLDDDGTLHWPVMLLYPEYSESDFIMDFNENDRLSDHLEQMFGAEAEPAPWDRERRYHSEKLLVYFEDKNSESLHAVTRSATLIDILKQEKFVVYGGTPSFIVLSVVSPFTPHFLRKYGIGKS